MLVKIAFIKNSTNNKCWRGWGEKATLLHCDGNANKYSYYGKQCGDPLKKLEIELPYDPAIPLWGIHTKETRIERDICTPVFISALYTIFTIDSAWKPPRFPLTDEWIRQCGTCTQWNIQFSSVQSLSRVRLFVTP